MTMGSPKYQNDGDPRTRGPGFGVTMHSESVLEPILKWPRGSRMAFLDSMSDVFHARVSADFLGQVFATMALTTQHTYQILTKRPNRMRDLLGDGRLQRAMQGALLNLRRAGSDTGLTPWRFWRSFGNNTRRRSSVSGRPCRISAC
jgi:protein gp37